MYKVIKMQLRQRVYEALQGATRKLSYKELAVMANSNAVATRACINTLNKIDGIEISIERIDYQDFCIMDSDAAFDDVAPRKLTMSEHIINAIDQYDEPISLIAIIETCKVKITVDDIYRTVSKIRREQVRFIELIKIDGMTHYKFIDSTPIKQVENVKHIEPVEVCEPVTEKVTGLIFGKSIAEAIRHNRIIQSGIK